MMASVVTMVRMARVWVLLSIAVVTATVPPSQGGLTMPHFPACRTLKDEKVALGLSRSYSCPAEECSGGLVYGTDVYHEDSDICLAALHSGVITNLPANITITHLSKGHDQVLGTVKNRIMSLGKAGSVRFPVYRVDSTVQEEGEVGEVMLVHNFARKDVIRFICLSQDQKSNISSRSLKSWNYADIALDVKSGEGSPKLELEAYTRENRHAVRLLGSRRDEDVLAVLQYPNAEFQAMSATVRASIEENVVINFLNNTAQVLGQVYVKRLPETWPPEPSAYLPLRLSPARLSDNGIYIVHDDTSPNKREWFGAYYDVLVRGCRRDFYGVACAKQCPKCLNGGECHSQRGTCVCAPGFIGDSCQYACPPGFFGNECQFKCHGRTVALRDQQRREEVYSKEKEDKKDEDEEGGCRGFTMCLPPPYGCSCAAGFTHPSEPGATCTQRCPNGRYGANCEQRCDDCVDGACHPYSGTCTRGCINNDPCREGPPRPVLVLISHLRGYEASWGAATDFHARYFVSQQLLHRLSCASARTQKYRMHFQSVTTPTYKAAALLPYAAYNVCVVVSSPAGLSFPGCSTVNTLPEAPSMNITQLTCDETRDNELQCIAKVSDGCESHNGPNLTIKFVLHTQLSCPSNLTMLRMSVKLSDSSAKATFPKYLAGKTYTVEAVVENLYGSGNTRNRSYTTHDKAPPPVRNVTHAILSDSAIQLLWNDPCPPNGEIHRLVVSSTYEENIPLQSCATTDLYDRCHNITGLVLGKKYEYCIRVENKYAKRGPKKCHEITLEEKEPGPPQAIRMMRGARYLNLTLVLPIDPGGRLRNCTIILTHSREPCVVNIFEGSAPVNCEFRGLEEGRVEEAEARCCNARYCGRDLRQGVATQPLPPQIDGDFHIVKKTNTTITLRFPAVTRKRDGNISVIVFVQLETPNKTLDLSAEVVRLFEAQRQKTVGKRSALWSESQCREQLWVAAELDQGQTEFVVGDGKKYRGFNNCPLQRGKTYNVGIIVMNELLGATAYSRAIEEAVVVVPYDSSPSSLLFLLLLLLLLLVLVILGALAYYRRRKHPDENEWMARFCSDVRGENANNHELQDTNLGRSLPVLVTQDIVENDAIYENLKPASCAVNATQVPYAEVEAYLNKVIGTAEAGEDFRTVPRIIAKSRTAAERPENSTKNRFRNILPYDDTRVVLSCLGDDPFSDYINASHVEGYGDMRYIASQGPKDANVCTIADFLRMVLEQRIDVIIMLANFVEMGKKKVGEYFSPGQTLNFDGFEVTMNRKKQLPYFTVSSLTVRWKEEERQVQHYHYTKWPDHGVPTEAVSIAQMLNHFQSHHRHGGTVVHCSAGIGRTGTVLQVLLMCEMLGLRGYLSSLEVLARLRMSRALLVENEAQYNLSLEILEEMQFGKETTMSADHFMKHLDECVLSSRVHYARAKALPSPLTYNTSNLPVFLPLNRNQTVLPADSNRYYLQAKAGDEVELSQYINAIRVLGQDKNNFMLATEHPMPHTVANFWRLVVETGSTLVFFINSLENEDDNDYPTMLRGPGEEWETEDYKLKQEKTEPYGTWLTHSKLTIYSSGDWIHHVDVYQSNDWPLSSPLPPSPHILLTLAELLQVPRSHTAGPPLLCCSDGVTGCGLVAGMTLVVEGLQTAQEVNVYRTVVRLLRARQQFIVSEEQFSTLYTGAAIYLQEYSDYGNFQ